jgi:hypothetical protein
VGAAPFEPRPGVRVSLSISAGAARFPLDGTSFDELMAARDERMYQRQGGTAFAEFGGRHSLAQSEGHRAMGDNERRKVRSPRADREADGAPEISLATDR